MKEIARSEVPDSVVSTREYTASPRLRFMSFDSKLCTVHSITSTQ